MGELIQGWGFPTNSRKAHFFLASEPISVCGKWMYSGTRTPDEFESPDDCKPCRRIANRQLASQEQEASGES